MSFHDLVYFCAHETSFEIGDFFMYLNWTKIKLKYNVTDFM